MEDFFQFSVFDCEKKAFKIDKPIRLIELFAGIGSQAKALERLGVDFEHYRICEFDKYAVASYNAVHGTNFTTSDITKITAKDLGIVDTYKCLYMMTYSFPCQDLSLAGLGKGMQKGSGTRSGLLWEVERLLNECSELPQVLLMENVTQVHGTKNKEHFDEWIKFLESKGYSNYWKDLNSKNFGVPQNRNRTFMVSVLGDYTYEFPKEFPLELRLKDMLEDSVDEKFYLSDKAIQGIKNSTYERKQHIVQKKDWYDTLLSRDYKDPKCVEVGMLSGGKWDKMHDVSRRVYSEEGISPTIHTCGGGNTEPKVIGGIGEKKSNGGTQWYQQDRIYDNNVAISVTTVCNPYYKVDEPTMRTIDACGDKRVIENCYVSEKGVRYICDPQRGMATDVNADVSQPLTAKGQSNWTGSFISPDIESLEKSSTIGSTEPTKINLKNGEQITSNDNLSKLRIRKLTPKECWRLMGFDDADFEKASQYNSNSQLYKQAGNSIVVDVLYYIFKQMIAESEEIL